MDENAISGFCGCILFIGIILAGIIPLNIQTGSGQHVGYITAVDTKTFLSNQTVVYFKTDLISTQEDKYCISNDNKELISKAKEAQVTKSNVILDYKNLTMTGLFNCAGDVIQAINSK